MELTNKIKDVVQACHKLEVATSNLLDKSQIINIVNVIVASVSKRIDDPDVLDELTNEFLAGIENASAIANVSEPLAIGVAEESHRHG